MKHGWIAVERSEDGGKTWKPTTVHLTSQIGHNLTKGGLAIVHQIVASYRLPRQEP